jgi:hypothetical protein
MIEETIRKIENKIQDIPSLSEEKKQELSGLVATLKSEAVSLAATHSEHAESIVRFAELSAHEAARKTGQPELQDISRRGLAASVEGFEATHPRLVEAVNQISQMLSNLGI